MTVLLSRTKKGRSGNEFYLAQHVSGRSNMHCGLFSHFHMFSFYGTELATAFSVSFSHFEQAKIPWGKKKEKSEILSKLGSEATPAA